MDPELIAALGKYALKALPFAACAVAAVIATETFEHQAPWGMAHALSREIAAEPAKLAAAKKEGIDAQAATDRASFQAWSSSLEACNSARSAAQEAAAAAQSRADAQTSTQASAAYRLGRATCGGNANASTPSHPMPGAPGAAGGVRDDGDDFADAFGSGSFTAAP